MSEPTLEDIGDYNTLKGEKKKIVWSVIIVGIVIGIIYVVVSKNYSNVNDAIQTEQTIKVSPMGKTSVPMR